MRRRLADTVGLALGTLLSPITGAISRLRQARMFHPEGIVYEGRVEPIATSADLARVGDRLRGDVLVRLSSAWWKNEREWPDVLGLAMRFRDEQDLLFATVRFPWTTPFAPLATNIRSFLFNHFHAVSPFVVEGLSGRVKLRLRSPRDPNRSGLPRRTHLALAVVEGRAAYVLEARRLERPLHSRSWEPIARVVLEHPIDVDQSALRFSPFLDGLGLSPVGLVHALRIATYASSQANRPPASLMRGNIVIPAGS